MRETPTSPTDAPSRLLARLLPLLSLLGPPPVVYPHPLPGSLPHLLLGLLGLGRGSPDGRSGLLLLGFAGEGGRDNDCQEKAPSFFTFYPRRASTVSSAAAFRAGCTPRIRPPTRTPLACQFAPASRRRSLLGQSEELPEERVNSPCNESIKPRSPFLDQRSMPASGRRSA